MKRTHLLLLCLLLLCAGCGSQTQSSAQPTAIPTIIPVPTPPDVPSRSVNFMTDDQLQLAGEIYGQGKTWVICSHMYGTTKAVWSDTGLPQRLAVAGYSVLIYDFRGNGYSEGDPSSTGAIGIDLSAAVKFAHHQGATRIVLMGASMGGTASLKVATEEKVAAVISLSGPQDFGVNNSDDDIKSITAPKLFLVSQDDESDFVTDTKHMYDIATPPKELHIYSGTAHGTYIFGDINGDEPAQRIIRFIKQYAPAS